MRFWKIPFISDRCKYLNSLSLIYIEKFCWVVDGISIVISMVFFCVAIGASQFPRNNECLEVSRYNVEPLLMVMLALPCFCFACLLTNPSNRVNRQPPSHHRTQGTQSKVAMATGAGRSRHRTRALPTLVYRIPESLISTLSRLCGVTILHSAVHFFVSLS